MRIEQNLTGYQVQTILDTLLYTGVEAIIYGSKYIDRHLVGLLNYVVHNNRRKISSADKGIQLSCLTCMLRIKNPHKKLRLYIRTRFDRYVTFEVLEQFLKATDGYKTTTDETVRRGIELGVGSSETRLGPVITLVEDALSAAYEFRNYIIEKYIGLCRQEATRQKMSNSIPISSQDLSQNLIQAVVVALNKYSYRKGALTSYIKLWMRYLSQSPEFPHEKGLAYDIPHNHRSKIGLTGNSNLGVTIEDDSGNGSSIDHDETAHISTSQHIEQEQQEKLLLRLMQIADPKGILRLSLGVDEVVTNRHRSMMKHQMYKQRHLLT